MKYPLTLLAPARDLEVGRAAIQAGADAVYIGAPRFGARQAAGNSIEDLTALVEYAHLFGVQVLVTLNTLLSDDERREAAALAWQLYEIGVDALIIQDFRLLDEKLPPIRLHASTQCDNRTAEDVLDREQRGFRRVVLARELSIDEIRAIREKTTVELEAFVHGALCVSYSGRCYASEVLLGRSANRGCCAQMCRMRYDLLDKDGQEILDDKGEPIHQRYLLSLQDMDRSLHLRELIDAGVTTFKIEGRLKDKDYVTNIVAYYRRLLDQIQPLSGIHPTPRSDRQSTDSRYTVNRQAYYTTFRPNPEKTFHRGGIDYFLHGRTTHMANWETPKSTGEYIGEVQPLSRPNGHPSPLNKEGKSTLVVRLKPGITLHNGDGLSIGDQGFSVNGVEQLADGLVRITPNKTISNLPPLTRNSPLPIYGERGAEGERLFRNLDVEFVKSLHAERRIVADITLTETANGFRLTIGSHSREFDYEKQPAKNAERALQTIREQLSKLGDTIYEPGRIDIQLSEPYFIPISILNLWRRETLQPSH